MIQTDCEGKSRAPLVLIPRLEFAGQRDSETTYDKVSERSPPSPKISESL
jgi:hypothetical protein